MKPTTKTEPNANDAKDSSAALSHAKSNLFGESNLNSDCSFGHLRPRSTFALAFAFASEFTFEANVSARLNAKLERLCLVCVVV